MCFYIRKSHPRAIIATHNILGWKNLIPHTNFPDHAYSPWRHHLYMLDSVETAKLGKIDHDSGEIKMSMRNRTPFANYSRYQGIINEGLHCYSNVGTALNGQRNGGREFTYPCVIPVGTKFYFDPDRDELVAEKLWVFSSERRLMEHFGVKKIGNPIKI